MNDSATVAVEIPAEPAQRPKPRPGDAKPKKQPPYAVIVLNDDEHSFPYVIDTFSKVFGYCAGPAHPRARPRDRLVRLEGSGGTQARSDPRRGARFSRREEGRLSPGRADRSPALAMLAAVVRQER